MVWPTADRRTNNARGLYGQLEFLPTDEMVMQRPRPIPE
jgi:hypothetical protein